MGFALHSGLGGHVPHVLYFGAIVAFLLSSCWRPHVGLYYLTPLMPLQELRDRVNDLPWGEHLVPFVMLGVLIGVLFRAKGQGLPKNPMNWLLVTWMFLSYISLWTGSFFLGTDLPVWILDPRFSDWKDYMLMLTLFFLVACAVKDVRQIKILVLLMCLSAFVVFRGFFLTVVGRDFSHFSNNLRQGTALGYAGANGLGAFEAQLGLFLLGLYAFEKKKLWKFAMLASILTCVYCLLFVFSRGAYFAFMVGLIYLGVFKERKLVLAGAVILIGWQTLLPISVQERITMTYQQGGLESSAGARLSLWEEAQSLVVSNPVLGSGFDTYKFLNHFGGLGDTHNYYLKVLVEMGVVGLLLYLLLLANAFRLGHNLFRSAQDPFLKGFGLGFAALMVGAVVLNLFGDRWTFLQVNGFLFILMGCVVRGQQLAEKGALDAEAVRSPASLLAPATDHGLPTKRALPANSNSMGKLPSGSLGVGRLRP